MTRDSVDKLLIQWGEERPDVDVAGLAVVVRIQHLAKALTDHAGRALEPLDLTLWEYDVLSALRRQGAPYRMAASNLARASLLSSGAMTHRINRLEQAGLVARSPDAEDRRAVLVGLTSRGVALIDAAIEARTLAANQSLAPLDAAERNALARLLRKLLLADAGSTP